jgi:peptide-methionine (S)-S-oxide reductase
MINSVVLFMLSGFSLMMCRGKPSENLTTQKSSIQETKQTMSNVNIETATFGNGCFWCTEAIFQRVEGVLSVASGYTGGKVDNPTYEQVCDFLCAPKKGSYTTLLEIFWKTHDPTTLNRQGNDVGTQYRSAIFYHNDEQKQLAEKYKKDLEMAKVFDSPIVTEIVPLGKYYKAEDYHQNYFNRVGSSNGYCSFVIVPKLEKFKKVFGDKLKKEPVK